MSEFYEIQQLVKLFNPPRDDDNSDSDDENLHENTSTEPSVESKHTQKKTNPYDKVQIEKKDNEKSDVYDFESSLTSEDEPSPDWKKTPKWNISYRQQVSASDVFLQMGAKTPATASCEDMIVTIDLPGQHVQNMDIKVHKNELVVYSPNFSVKIPLPHPVHPQKGDAKWDKEQEKLTVTLRMEREFDFINF
ncbi:hypothetical protein Zmor_014296 [Zophobas morio]|uniref:PIH1D1/2/3 CS-like domain-containing protein n=1 Tax=Zophobas morio TaxID=2755281 RepID=A0AA38IHI8_9CUCU|nr:hypothetical protein Zmor_014296 [Zophobas morio]